MTLHTSTITVPRPRSRVWASFGENVAYAIGLPILLLVIWGIWASASPAPFFPSPLIIFEAFVDTWVGPAFVTDVLPSLGRLALGIVLSVLVGIVAGTLIGLVRWLRDLLEPMLEFFRAIPPPVLIPIVAVLLGPTDTMKVTVIVAGSVWPVLLNTIDGVRATDSVMTERAIDIEGAYTLISTQIGRRQSLAGDRSIMARLPVVAAIPVARSAPMPR